MYHPLHECPEIKTFELIDEQLVNNRIKLYNIVNEQGNIISVNNYVHPYLNDKEHYLDNLNTSIKKQKHDELSL